MPSAPRHDGWTPARRAQLLDHLRRGHSIRTAAAALGMSVRGLDRLRARDPDFAAEVAAAAGHVSDMLLPDLLEAALHGREVRTWHRGKLVAVERTMDTRLAVRLLRAVYAREGRTPPP